MTTELKNKESTFFCRACLLDRDIKGQSDDERYCRGCFTSLVKEAEGYSTHRAWMPRTEPVKERAHKDKSINATIKRLEKVANGKKKRVIAESPTPHQATSPCTKEPVTPIKTGKPTTMNNVTATVASQRAAMVENILKLSAEGRSTRHIAGVVNKSHMTVARVIAGQRVLV